MGKRLYNFGQQGINVVFLILFGATTLFALIHPNLIVGDNWRTGAGTTIVTAGLLIAGLAIVIGLYAYPRFASACHWVFVQHGRITASILLAAVVGWQLVFVLTLHPPIGWDAGALHQALTDTTSPNIRAYYSQNFNNVPVLLMMHAFATWFHTTAWLMFDLVTLGFVDLAAALNLVTIALMAKRHLTAGLYVHALWLSLFATIIVPYTDAWVLPLVAAMFFGYAVLTHQSWAFGWRLLGTVPLSIGAVAAYFIKPSAIVPVIAMLVVTLLYALRAAKPYPWRHIVIGSVVLLGMFAGSYLVINHSIQTQRYIQVDHSRAIPAVHFMSMGVSGQGGYNAHDALMMAVLPTKQARSAYSIKMLKQRLRRMGVGGYLVFLVHKQYNNTADGSFAWDKEGSFINENPKPKPGPGLKNHLQQFVYLYGTNLGDYRWWTQAMWVVALVLILVSSGERRRDLQVLRVTIIGAFIYMLLFEGGRSRYVIQYLPAFLILLSQLAKDSVLRIRRLFAWGDYALDGNERRP